MWLIGVFGMATKYSETLMSVKYRVQSKDGRMLGGAMYALERGLGQKWLAVIFAVLAALAAFGIGCMTQSNSIADACSSNFGVPRWIVGLVIAVITAVVIIGGVKSITKVCEKLVPFMALLYVIGCIVILVMNYRYIVPAVVLIIKSAFSVQAGFGGAAGFAVSEAIRFGCARGLFSNESGMGSAPLVAAAAKTKNPVRQSLISMTGTFWDTVVICLMTGLTLVSSVLAHPELGGEMSDDTVLTFAVFDQIPYVGRIFITVSLSLFAFTTILRLVLLRRAGGGISHRPESHEDLQSDLHSAVLPGNCGISSARLEYRGYPQRPDGHSERNRRNRPQWGHHCGGQKISPQS